MRRSRSPRTAAALIVAGLALAACGSDDASSGSPSSEPTDSAASEADSPTEQAASSPVTVENCGETVTFDQAPQRAVPVDQNVTEMLLTLGVEDDIAAYARQHFNPNQPVLPEFQSEYDALERLGDAAPSRELFLQAEPDFALAAFGFSDDSGLSRAQLTDDGIPTYLLPDQCPDRSEPASFDDLYTTMRDLGTIFGQEEQAETLISEWEQQIADVTAEVEGLDRPSVFVYDSGEDAPFTVGGTGVSNAIIDAAGGQNIFADTEDAFFDGSWEAVLESNPDVIIVMDYFHGEDGETNDSKLAVIDDRLGSTAAVQNGMVISLDLTGFFLSVRNPDMVTELASVLHP